MFCHMATCDQIRQARTLSVIAYQESRAAINNLSRHGIGFAEKHDTTSSVFAYPHGQPAM